jgi:outer membrane protein TolC
VENDLIRYRAAVSEAQVAQSEAIGRVARLMGSELNSQVPGWRATDALPEASRPPPTMEQAVARAFELRADLRQRQAALERERLQAEYAANQVKPKVDVVASYGFNGGPGSSQAGSVSFLKDFPSWSVGLQVAMPLGGNIQGRADVQAAKLRLSEAQRQIEALRREIASDVATGVTLMSGAAQRWELWSEIARREDRHVQLERQRLESGRSDVRELLFREERAINARMAVVEQQVAWSKAEALIEATQGLLLDRFR